jgi:hypothetical protein
VGHRDDPKDPSDHTGRVLGQVAFGRLIIDPHIEGDELRARVERIVRLAMGGRADVSDLVIAVVRLHEPGRPRWVVTVHNLNHGEVPGAGALLEAALARLDPGGKGRS